MLNQEQLYNLSKSKTPQDIIDMWDPIAASKDNLRAIIALENYTNDIIPKTLEEKVFLQDNDFLSYFQTSNLYFIDNRILADFLITKQDASILIDYTLMFDTQYATYIHNFINGQTNKFNNDVWNSIDILLRNDFNYDYSFYLIENSKQINLNIPFNINDFKNSHLSIFENIISLELFKSIDHELYKQEGKVHYTISKTEAEVRATKIIIDIFGSKLGGNVLQNISFMHKQMTLFLIGVLKIHFSSKKNAQKKLVDLFSFMHNSVGIYFDRESIIAYKYFKKASAFKIFNKIQKNREIALETIENISWDFMAPRIMEAYTRIQTNQSFFIPFILTHDIGLKELITSFDVKGIIIGGSYGTITLPAINTQEYFQGEQCNIDTKFYFSDESLSYRKNLVKENEKSINQKINDEYNSLIDVLLK